MEKRVRKKAIPQEVIDLGLKIREIMTKKGFKTRDVAYESDMDVENFRKYLNGRQEMKVSTMLKIAKALNVNVGELFDHNLK
jgi:transcriptional regulator with XRE-family HTH domain